MRVAALMGVAAAGVSVALAVGQASATTTPTVVSLTTPGFTSFTGPPAVTSVTLDAAGGSGGSVVGLSGGGGYTKVITPGGQGAQQAKRSQ